MVSNRKFKRAPDGGFSVIEMIIAMALMLVLMGVAFTFARDSIRSSLTTFELTAAQQSVRAAHEYISRDLVSIGDGLNGMPKIRVPANFVTNYLTKSPFVVATDLALITSDNNVPAGTNVPGANPAVTVRSNPVATDRLTMMQIDRAFTPVALPAAAIVPANMTIAVSLADIDRFQVNDILFVASVRGATFVTVTDKDNGALLLRVTNSDQFGLNQSGAGSNLNIVSVGSTQPASLMRMHLIQYFVASNGLLIRRIFGAAGGVGVRDSVIAEHVLDMQIRYALNERNPNGTIRQPVAQLSIAQQVFVRQVEVTLNLETVHPVNNGKHQNISMTTSTSVRNLQFRQALQPTADN